MIKIEDLTGKIFGNLAVIEKIDKRQYRSIVWKCQCRCGNIVEVASNRLRSGHTKSCGCLKITKLKERYKDLTGEKFGRLLVTRHTQERQGTSVVWECKCACGNTVLVSSNSLQSGNTKSCGCFHSDRTKEANSKDIKGQRFGRLTPLFPTQRRDCAGSVKWICLCNCGKYTEVASRNLISKVTKSCGCLNEETRRKLTTERNIIHGLSKTKEYRNWLVRKRKERKKIFDVNWTLEMELALKEFQPYCVVCGAKENLAVDHVKPLSKGNGLIPGNSIILCRSCNSIKHIEI